LKRIKLLTHTLVICLLLTVIINSAALGDETAEFIANDEAFKLVFPKTPAVEIVVDSERDGMPLKMVEGPTWLNGTLFFSDQPRGFHSLKQDGSWSQINFDGWTCGSAALKNGNLAVCYVESTTVVEMKPDGSIINTLIDTADGETLLGNPNDMVIDSKGGIYVTLSPFFGKNVEKNTVVVYRKPNGETMKVLGVNELGFTNGCCLSPDESKFYLTDTKTTSVWVFDIMPDGGLSNKQVFATLESPPGAEPFEEGKWSAADGMVSDSAGNIFVTSRLGLHVFSKDGTDLGLVRFHDSPSNCVFGGTEMKTLYVTCKTKIYAIQMTFPG